MLTKPTAKSCAIIVLLSRLMKVTFAFRISPEKVSGVGGYGWDAFGSAAVISWIVALSVTVALPVVGDDVDTNNAPEYVARASSLVTVNVPFLKYIPGGSAGT